MESKTVIYLIFALVAASFVYFYLTSEENPPTAEINENRPETPTAQPNNASAEETPAVNISPETTAATPPPAKCGLCHLDPKNITAHVNGGKYCINCHGTQVHSIHVGPGTMGLDCPDCHGLPPTTPSVEAGHVVCEKCHAPPPNSLEPSYGNLIVIHLSRGKYCTNCHGNDIGSIHKQAWFGKGSYSAPKRDNR